MPLQAFATPQIIEVCFFFWIACRMQWRLYIQCSKKQDLLTKFMFFQLMDVRCKYSPANSRMFRRCTVVNTSSVTIHFLPIRSNVFYTVILCKLAISHWLIWAANYTSVICRSARTTHRHRHRSLFSSMDPGILQFQRAVASYNAWHTFTLLT